MSTQETHETGRGFNQSSRMFPSDLSIYALFEECAHRNESLPAIVDGTRIFSYGQLNAQARALSTALLGIGISAGEPVGLMMPRSADMIIAQLAILAIGAIYVPIDVDWPTERTRYIRDDLGIRYALHSPQCEIAIESVACLNIQTLLRAEPSAAPGARDIKATATACVLYTSGSTGAPKGVLIPHQGISRLAFDNGYADIAQGDRVAHASNPAFDASTFEVWVPLLNGAAVVVVPKQVMIDVRQMEQFLCANQINVLFLTTAIFHHYVSVNPRVFRGLKYVLFGGEAGNAATARRVIGEDGPEVLMNMYGPTESTTFATCWHVDGTEGAILPIGRPISNTRIHILDGRMNAVPVGEVGELYIGGCGVASGYVNRRELTAEKFIADPFSSEPGARLYRTGDLGRWRTDGAIEYLGRNDRQIKIRGFRIEPEEIETVLNMHDEVEQCAVVCRNDSHGQIQLICYVTLNSTAPPEHEEAQWRRRSSLMFRDYLSERLPDYMVPPYIVALRAFPLTSSGKIDRRAIQDWELPQRYSDGNMAEPQTPLELLLVDVWQSVLGVRQLGVDDSFFDNGGDSLMAGRIVAELGRRGENRATPWMVSEHPTIRELAAAMLQNETQMPPVGSVRPISRAR